MAGELTITVIGALGADPELRFTPSGAAVANFSIGTNARTFNKDRNEWEDGPTTWINCSAWRELAENVAESLVKGTRVIVQGHLTHREYETRDGSKGKSLDLNVQAIGPDLRWATAKVSRAQRSQGHQGGGQQQRHQDPSGGGWGNQQGGQQPDPWATPQHGDEPPF